MSASATNVIVLVILAAFVVLMVAASQITTWLDQRAANRIRQSIKGDQ
ncbi:MULTISPECIES: hypothetical protein [unclassified Streptomyces]